ncbi:GH39 family glycosyl hydrolase [Parasediminibacterium sp. JCM 36343]|uniref:GH39 family glycosyl hydrolase n=1 Tax=Parasediminibacterium sp. JCM 36343 TaxID=3374279 RepID=UPI00397A0F07
MNRIFFKTCFAFFVMICFFINVEGQEQSASKAIVNIDFAKEKGEMKPIWAWFGYDEPNYTYMKDGKKLLSEIAELSPVPVYVRAHNLLTSGDGTPALKWGSTNVYTEDANGNPVYYWNIVDSIFDTYIQRGMKPLAQIGFMPEALSTHPQPYKHTWKPGDPYSKIITGWAYPPKDYKKWGDLCYEWVKHCVARYGAKEVASWYWEVWNEADGSYWKGTAKEFYKLYDYAADGVKRALPTARIGGCDATTGGIKFSEGFIRHCLYDTNYVTGKIGSPLEVFLFHAKGRPGLVRGVVRMDVSKQLRIITDYLTLFGKYPELNGLPIIIGESDPEGCAACGMATNPSNAYRNGTMYSSYTAASIARVYELAAAYNVNLIGAVNWSFEFENQPWFAGFRDLATNGIDKPVLNVFRMFGKMGGQFVEASSSRMYDLKDILDSSVRKQADVGVLASKNGKKAAIMLWNYHDNDGVGVSEHAQLNINGIPAEKATMVQYIIDTDHSNAYEAWKKMGSPQPPSESQIAMLEKLDGLQKLEKEHKINIVEKGLLLNIELPKQSVSLLTFEWK